MAWISFALQRTFAAAAAVVVVAYVEGVVALEERSFDTEVVEHAFALASVVECDAVVA